MSTQFELDEESKHQNIRVPLIAQHAGRAESKTPAKIKLKQGGKWGGKATTVEHGASSSFAGWYLETTGGCRAGPRGDTGESPARSRRQVVCAPVRFDFFILTTVSTSATDPPHVETRPATTCTTLLTSVMGGSSAGSGGSHSGGALSSPLASSARQDD